MRLFFALDIAAAIRATLTAYVDTLRRVPGIRFMPPESYHLTLKFLGEVKDIDRVQQAASLVQASALEISFRETGFFLNTRAPRVFWAGIHSDERLPALASALDEALAKVGYAREERPFRPHLTLARSGSGSPTPRSEERPVAGFRALVAAVEKTRRRSSVQWRPVNSSYMKASCRRAARSTPSSRDTRSHDSSEL
jgi:2'-5' RNA ligase